MRCPRFLILAVAILLVPKDGSADAVPRDLASLSAAIYEQVKDQLTASNLDSQQRAAAERTLAALQDLRIRFFSTDPVVLSGAAADLAEALGLDLADAEQRETLVALLAMDERAAREELEKTLDGAEIDAALEALANARKPGERATRHEHTTPGGDRVILDWRPQEDAVVVTVRNGRNSSGDERFETSMVGRTRLEPDPETGDLSVSVEPAATPLQVLTQTDFDRIARSIFATWEGEDGTKWTFAPLSEADREAGNIRRSPAAVRAEINEVEQRIRDIEAAKEYVWRDDRSGEIVRQRRFRRLPEPWVFKGKVPLMEDADTQVAELRDRLAALRSELTGADLPPVEREDPVEFNAAALESATPIGLEITRPSGYSFPWDEVNFDGRTVRGRRTVRSVQEDLNEALPMAVRQQLVASWSPPNWLDLTANVDPVTNELQLSGNRWSMHVT